jgi:hypothetical protein
MPHHYEFIRKTVPCPRCGTPHKARFQFNMLESEEMCDSCGEMVTFKREIPKVSSPRW